MKVSKDKAKQIADKLGVNLEVVGLDMWIIGMNVELEHGKINKKTDVTHNDLIKTGKIALAHLVEFPDYYQRLVKLEAKAEKYWKNKKKPVVILPEKLSKSSRI